MPVITSALIANQNFCEEEFFKKIAETKKRDIGDSELLINILQERPFDEEASLKLIEIFKKDLSLNPNNIQKYNKDRMFWNVISYVAIFTFSDAIKKELLAIYTNNKKEIFSSYSYRNFLVLKNIGGLNNEKRFLEQIKDSSTDNLFKMFYQINYASLKIEPKLIETYKKELSFNLSSCSKRELLLKTSSQLDFLFILKLFIYSKIFQDKENEIKKYFYAISNNISIWEYLEYIYYKEKKNLIAGQKLQLFFGLENEVNSVKRFVINGYIEVADNALNMQEYNQAWNYSVLSTKLILSLEDFSKKDMSSFLKSKSILQKSSKELISIYIQKKDQLLTEHIYKQTNNLLSLMPKIKG